MNELMSAERIAAFLYSVLRVSTPIIYGGLAAVITQKSGLLNMAIESMMLASALTGVLVSGATQNLLLGVFAGVASAVMITLILSYSAFIMKVDLYLTSIALNTALVGGTVFVMFLAVKQKSNTVGHIASLVVPEVELPLIKDIPFLGEILSGHNLLTYLSFVFMIALWFMISKTKIGLRIRAVGENPQAAISVGISPVKIYFLTFAMAGVLAGLGGIFMSMGYTSWFQKDMIAGRGFIGMSAMNVTGGSPFLTVVAAIVFGAADALANVLQMSGMGAEYVISFPYAFTIVMLTVLAVIRNIRFAFKRKNIRKQQLELMNSIEMKDC